MPGSGPGAPAPGGDAELHEGDTVHVREHGPGVLLSVAAQRGRNKFKVCYPNGDVYHVAREQILYHQPASQGRGVSARSPSPVRARALPSAQTAPRQVEYLGREFNSSDRTMPAPAAIFSLVATMVGGGVLSLPYAMSQCGIVLGTLSLFLAGAATFWTLEMLVECARSTGRDTFELVGHAALGEPCRKATIALVFAICWLSQVAYFVLLADLLVPLVEHLWPSLLHGFETSDAQRRVVLAAATAVLSPMCFRSSLSVLRFLCFASVGSVLFVGGVIAHASVSAASPHAVAVAVPHAATGSSTASCLVPSADALFPVDWMKALYVFPMFGVSFLCHFNALPTHQELRRPTRGRVRRVMALTLAFTSLLYLAVGLFGYLYAGDCTCGNILLNFKAEDPGAQAGRLMLAAVLMLNFPLILQPCRNALYRMLLFTGVVGRGGGAEASGAGDVQPQAQPELAAPWGDPAARGDSADGSQSCRTRGSSGSLQLCGVPSDPDLAAQEPSAVSTGSSNAAARPRAASPTRPAGASPARAASPDPRRPASMGARVHVYTRQSTSGFMRSSDPPLEALDAFAPKDETVQQSACEPTTLQRYVLTVFLLASALGVASFMKSILVVWSILGSTVAFLIAFILPVAFWLKIVGHRKTPCKRLAAWFLLVTCSVLAVACTVLTVTNLNLPACPDGKASLDEARFWIQPGSEVPLISDQELYS